MNGKLTDNLIIHNHLYTLRIPKGTEVRTEFDRQTKTAQIVFATDQPVRLIKMKGQWYASLYGSIMPVNLPHSPPFPVGMMTRQIN